MKASNMSDKGAKELCVAIIKQAVDDYELDVLHYLGELFRIKGASTRAILYGGKYENLYGRSLMEKGESYFFFDTEWFQALIGPVGNIHGDTIRRECRRRAMKEAIKRGYISPVHVPIINRINGWKED